jgi:hypothetical protein
VQSTASIGQPIPDSKPDNTISPIIPFGDESEPKKKTTVDKVSVDRVYASYPTRCVIQNKALGKTEKNKKKIARLMVEGKTEGELIKAIDWYVRECTKSKTYMKNFGTFRALNADTAANYLESSFQFVTDAYNAGYDGLITDFYDQSILNIFRAISKNPPNPEMGYSAAKLPDGGFRVTLQLGPLRKAGA